MFLVTIAVRPKTLIMGKISYKDKAWIPLTFHVASKVTDGAIGL